MYRLLMLFLLCEVLVFAPAEAQSAQRTYRVTSEAPAPMPMSPSGTAIFDSWAVPIRARLAAIQSHSGNTAFADELAQRTSLDQDVRKTDLLNRAPVEDRKAIDNNATGLTIIVGASNTAFLKAHIPADGWFRFSRDGRQVAQNAWLIVQHTADDDLRHATLAQMSLLVGAKEADGRDYALLYDRVALMDGGLQRYGSQLHCVDHHFVPFSVEDPEHLDARRAEMGMTPIAEYLKRFGSFC